MIMLELLKVNEYLQDFSPSYHAFKAHFQNCKVETREKVVLIPSPLCLYAANSELSKDRLATSDNCSSLGEVVGTEAVQANVLKSVRFAIE